MTLAQNQYDALTACVGFFELRDWTQIELTGVDRLKFLNNFCTADLKKLTLGGGTEAFICNVKGKLLGHVFVLQADDRLLLVTVPGQAATLIPHLDRYTLSDDVALRDASAESGLLHVSGALAEATLGRLIDAQLPQRWLDSRAVLVAGRPLLITRGLFGPNSFLVRTTAENISATVERLHAAGASQCDAAALEAVRIEAGVPLYGCDITDDNLPQEVNRDVQAISLTKGCYLGQETVARIDALGHVNRLLVGVQFFGRQVPTAGDALLVDDKPVGHVTSATFSPKLAHPLALAYVRAAHAQPGHRLLSSLGEAQVISLPQP